MLDDYEMLLRGYNHEHGERVKLTLALRRVVQGIENMAKEAEYRVCMERLGKLLEPAKELLGEHREVKA